MLPALALDPGVLEKELGADGVGAFILWLSRVFRLFNSEFSSFSLLSVVVLWLSIAVGIRSFRARTSSPIRLESSSRRLLAAFRSAITFSTSDSAESRRSVRACSADLSVSVSFDNWSRRVKAFSKESSIDFLSCSSCGGVGGAMTG